MQKKYKHLTYEDRKLIEKYVRKNYRVKDIAMLIGTSKSTIYNELKRCYPSAYSAKMAQQNH